MTFCRSKYVSSCVPLHAGTRYMYTLLDINLAALSIYRLFLTKDACEVAKLRIEPLENVFACVYIFFLFLFCNFVPLLFI